MTNILRAEQLAKSYKSKLVVEDVSLYVGNGEIVGLLGPNGAGKTTCFYMIVGLIHSDKGQVFINDVEVTGLPLHERARRGLGYLPQEPSVFRKLTTEQNILAILELQKHLSAAERQVKLEQLLAEFHIDRVRNTLGSLLSGGERRRVEIARAVAAEPAFILLDEPFAGVDPISVIDIKSIVQQLASRGIGVLITDHNVRETLDLCHRSYIVGHGHIIAHGDKNDILTNQKVRDIYLGEDFQA